jgi:hypothetical protein
LAKPPNVFGRRVGRQPARVVQASVFGAIAVCFALPFAHVSCASWELAKEVSSGFGAKRIDRQTFTGWELVAGTARLVPEELDARDVPVEPPDEEDIEQFRVPPEPFAQIAFVAGLAGLVAVVAVRDRASRALSGAATAAIIVVSLWLLVSSPSLKKIGILNVRPRIGYWLVLG